MEYLLGMLIAAVMLCTIGNFSACKVTNPEIKSIVPSVSGSQKAMSTLGC